MARWITGSTQAVVLVEPLGQAHHVLDLVEHLDATAGFLGYQQVKAVGAEVERRIVLRRRGIGLGGRVHAGRGGDNGKTSGASGSDSRYSERLGKAKPVPASVTIVLDLVGQPLLDLQPLAPHGGVGEAVQQDVDGAVGEAVDAHEGGNLRGAGELVAVEHESLDAVADLAQLLDRGAVLHADDPADAPVGHAAEVGDGVVRERELGT
jgi:hypothetical protein